MKQLISNGPNIRAVLFLKSNALEKISLFISDEGFICEGEELPPSLLEWFESYAAKQPLPIPFKITSRLASIAAVPFGETRFYSEIGPARAAGNACRLNPFPLIIPCHRVIAKSGLGGFAYGLEIKKRLLSFEGSL